MRGVQLDFNDKDQQGSYKAKVFREQYGYNIENALRELPLKDQQNQIERKLIIDKLKQGKRHAVSFVKDGIEKRYYIEANPQFKTVNIYDEHSRKVSFATATASKSAEAMTLIKKMDEHQDEGKNKRKGMHIT